MGWCNGKLQVSPPEKADDGYEVREGEEKKSQIATGMSKQGANGSGKRWPWYISSDAGSQRFRGSTRKRCSHQSHQSHPRKQTRPAERRKSQQIGRVIGRRATVLRKGRGAAPGVGSESARRKRMQEQGGGQERVAPFLT